MEDWKLSESTVAQLNTLCDQVRHSDSGTRILFSDSSGTGKTLAASWLSSSLGFPLFRVDLAVLVSKYVGETEKNIGELFDSSEKSKTILFFDEADALFGKRSDVRDSRDRDANLDTDYLLQRIEAYQGIVILASNRISNIDDQFIKPMNSIVEIQTLRVTTSLWSRLLDWLRRLMR